jgi:CheY-like chemotaxis protein
VQSLLTEARTEASAPSLVTPHDVVERVARVFERLCREREQVLTWSAAGALPPLEADGAALEQALGNLLRNASQATPVGGTLSLICRQRGRLVEFLVRDSGPGIPADALDRIFEPFFTTKAPGEGTGLGLSLAREIAHRHRGTLVAENLPAEEGAGAQFVMAIPFDRRAREREPGRVLVVEDDRDLRRALARYLTRIGWLVEEAEDGATALAVLANVSLDAVVCDARLPDMTGMALHAGTDPARRFVLISGDTGSRDVQAFGQQTGVVVLQKPFELEALAAALHAGGRGRE